MKKFKSPKLPLPNPLNGLETSSFAYITITERLPRIARDILVDNYFPPQVRQNLDDLIQEIPFSTLRPLKDTSAPDYQDWSHYLSPYPGKNWLQVPWFLAEMYFYRRILEAIGYYRPGSLLGYDPFLKQKLHILESASNSLHALEKQLKQYPHLPRANHSKQRTNLHKLLVLNVWGNQADLSMWSAREDRPDYQNLTDQHSHLLVDDSEAVFEYLNTTKKKSVKVGFILDNFGPELVNDIALADFLLSSGICASVWFHAKPYPLYVSDALIKDIHYTIDYLTNNQTDSLRRLGSNTIKHIEQGCLEFKEDYFWTSPLPFWQMPNHIHQELVESDLVISKGDANYRRLAGDLNWPVTTPFADVVRYFPSPLLALRVLKAELALGLTPDQIQRLDNQDPNWKVNGNWGVIQFSA